MAGAGGTLDALGQLLAAAGLSLPPWAGPVFGLALALALLPRVLAMLQVGQLRRDLGRARLLEGPRRAEAEARALDAAGASPVALQAVAEEALRQGRLALAADAVRRLEGAGGDRRELRKLQAALDPDPLPGTAAQLVGQVLQLRRSGLHARAAQRLERGRARWPGDPLFVGLDEEAQVGSPVESR